MYKPLPIGSMYGPVYLPTFTIQISIKSAIHVGKCTGPMDPSWVINYQSSPQQWHYWWLSWSPIMVQEIPRAKTAWKKLCTIVCSEHSKALHSTTSNQILNEDSHGEVEKSNRKYDRTQKQNNTVSFPNPSVDGFNLFEQILVKMGIFPRNRGEN